MHGSVLKLWHLEAGNCIALTQQQVRESGTLDSLVL